MLPLLKVFGFVEDMPRMMRAAVVEKVRFLATHPERLDQMSGNAGTLGKPAAGQAVCERVLAAVRVGQR